MAEDKIVQFVSFETALNTDQFINQWEQFNRSVNSDLDVSLQQSQSEKNGYFRYIAQHRFITGELKFTFSRAKKSSRNPEPEIKAKQAGGYLLIQETRMNDVHVNENKILAFLTDPLTDLKPYKQLQNAKLNIYEAYYENCSYAFILEFFVKNKFLTALLQELALLNTPDAEVYKECALHAV